MNQSLFNKYKSFSSKDFAADDDFVRYVCHPTEAESLFWEAFCDVFPGKSRDVREAKLLIQALQPDQSEMFPAEVESLWNVLSTKQNEIFSSRQVENKVQPALVKKAFLMTAVVLLSCLSGALLSHLLKSEEIFEYKTGFEQVATVFLPDSSKVILNANSSIKMWTTGWLKKKREMTLTGEANFNIKNLASSGRYYKLLVHTNSGTIEVTGTSFNVFSRGSKTKVYLKEGGIKLNDLPDLPVILMHPGDYIQYDVMDKTISKNKVASEKIDSWTLNKVVFDKTPFSDVLSHLKQIHGLGAVLENKSLLDKSFTGILPADDLDLLLKALEEAFDINISIKDNTLLINLK
ncbi:MAG: FecR family protein [Saprospiraceae bacterium]|jgi:transmembrane sensor|nr:FecR family protein [Saprospiraceae bacterium]